MRKIYLAGNISNDPETYKWRERATELLKDRYTVFNPAANAFNQKLLQRHEKNGDGATFIKDAVRQSQRILIVKDFNLIQSADIILVNLTLVTPDKPPIGTVFELAWSWLLKKPVVGIIPPDVDKLSAVERLYATHPFIVSALSAVSYSVEDACKLIHEFFGE